MTDSLSICARRVLSQHFGIESPSRFVACNRQSFSGSGLWRVHALEGEFAFRSHEYSAEGCTRLRFAREVIRFVCAQGFGMLSLPVASRTSGLDLVIEQSRIWELSQWLPGEADFEAAPSELRLRQAVHGLAEFHEVTRSFATDRGPSEGVRRRYERLRSLQSTLTRVGSTLMKDSMPEASLKATAQRLVVAIHDLPADGLRKGASHWTERSFTRSPILADPWLGNLLFSGQQFVGFVDYSTMRMDIPAIDFVRMVGSLKQSQNVQWSEAQDIYREIRPLEPEEQAFLIWLHVAGLVTAALNWLEWIFVHRQEFGDWRAVELRMASLAQELEELNQSMEDS